MLNGPMIPHHRKVKDTYTAAEVDNLIERIKLTHRTAVHALHPGPNVREDGAFWESPEYRQAIEDVERVLEP